MISMQRSGFYKRCVALALVLMLCLISFASVSHASDEATYGVVSARSLNLRAEPNSSAAILTSFPSGTWVQVLETSNGWYKVQVGEWVGYMSAQYVKLSNVTKVTDAQVSGASGYINLRASASAGAAVLATYPNGTRVKILGRANGFYHVSVGSLTGYMAEYLVRLDSARDLIYAVIQTTNGGNLNLRVSPSQSAAVIQSYAPGTRVEVLEMGSTWYKVRVQGAVGYMMAKFLVVGDLPVAPPTTPSAPNGKLGVVNNPKSTQVLNLRETASLNARVLAYYSNGKQVEILGSTGDWYKVRVDGRVGYMMKKFIKVTSAGVATPHPTVPFAATLRNLNGGSIVNFRDSASLSGAIIAAYPVGKPVTVLDYYNADWAYVDIDGYHGYVSAHFLKY